MVRDNRIKSYRFTVSELTSAAGNLDIYTQHAVNGTLQKIEFLGGNYTATGSLLLSTSGTTEGIFNFTSGTVQGNVAQASFAHPIVYATDLNGVAGSPQTFVQRVIGGEILRIIGSGLGTGKSGLGLNIIYI